MSHERIVPDRTTLEAEQPMAEAPATPLAEFLIGTVGPREPAAAPAFLTGHLRGLDADGRPLFQAEGAEVRVPVAIGIELSDGVIVKAARRERRAIVVRTADETPRWILIGLVRDRVGEKARDAKPGRLEVNVDGEKVKLEAEHDIELKCGAASITLRYDGRIEVKGTHILSASRGPNRVKGATIALN